MKLANTLLCLFIGFSTWAQEVKFIQPHIINEGDHILYIGIANYFTVVLPAGAKLETVSAPGAKVQLIGSNSFEVRINELLSSGVQFSYSLSNNGTPGNVYQYPVSYYVLRLPDFMQLKFGTKISNGSITLAEFKEVKSLGLNDEQLKVRHKCSVLECEVDFQPLHREAAPKNFLLNGNDLSKNQEYQAMVATLKPGDKVSFRKLWIGSPDGNKRRADDFELIIQ